MPIDVAHERALTPVCATTTTFLNHAGASPSPDPVVATVVDHLRREAQIGGYEAAAEARDRTQAVYDSVARLVNGHRDEIALVQSATEAWASVFFGLRLAEGDRILTGRSEYVSNAIQMLQVVERTGAEIVVVDDDEHGQVSVEQLTDLLDDRTRLIAIAHVPTNGGLVNPAEEVGRVARAAGVPYLLDACQSAGQIDLDVERIGCDALTATGRKFLRAPRGTGFAWVRRDLVERLEPPVLDSHSATWTGPMSYQARSDARRLETFEHSVAGRLGLGTAIDHALGLGLHEIEDRVSGLADHLRGGLAELDGVTVRDKGRRRCGIVTFTVEGREAAMVRARLDAEAITVWTSTADHARFDMPDRGLDAVVRASVHYVTTTEELDRTIDAVARLSAE